MRTIKDFTPKEHVMVLKDPHGEDTEGTITIVGRYSTEFYTAARDALRDKNIFDPELSVLEDENTKTLSACVKDWNEEFFCEPCTEENVQALLSNPQFHWVKEQLEAAVLNRANFFRTEDS